MHTQTITFMGSQGSGKGTQSDLIGKYIKEHDPANPLIELETGQHFRAMMSAENYTGQRIKELLDDGQMIPDFFTKHIVLEQLAPAITPNTHITMDGFPRTPEQVRFLDKLMTFYKRENLAVVYLDVPEDIVLARLTSRGRFDDTPELIAERIRDYKAKTMPIIEEYEKREDINFIHIDGRKTIAEIQNDLKQALGI